jgi:hypothetical protein
MTEVFGPPNPPNLAVYADVPDKTYLSGAVKKIIYDLNRLFKIYSGIEAKVYQFNRTGTTRCSVCTDTFTGEAILSNCSTCYGTGVIPGYIYIGTYAVGINFNPRINVATDVGNTITNGVKEDYFCIVGCQVQLQDRDLIILPHSEEVYKIVEKEPEITGMGGYLIMQVITAPLLEKGNVAYNLLKN